MRYAPALLAITLATVSFAQAPAVRPAAGEATRAAVQRYRAASDPAEAKRAFAELRSRASASPQAALACGLLASQKGSVVSDPAVATECLRAGAKAGSAEAQHLLAERLLAESGPGRAERRVEAEKLLAQAGRSLPESVYLLAQTRAERAGDPESARRKVTDDAAKAGYAPAQRDLAHRLIASGKHEEGRAWLEKASALGDAEAGYELATLLAEAKQEPDVPRIVELLERATQGGSPRAALALGVRLVNADGVKRDTARAHLLFRRAAASGLPEGQYALGYTLLDGVGVAANEPLALQWFEAAATQGNLEGMYALGNAHANGWGTGKSLDEAYRWYCRAAQGGHASATKLVRGSALGRHCDLSIPPEGGKAQPTPDALGAPALSPRQ